MGDINTKGEDDGNDAGVGGDEHDDDGDGGCSDEDEKIRNGLQPSIPWGLTFSREEHRLRGEAMSLRLRTGG